MGKQEGGMTKFRKHVLSIFLCFVFAVPVLGSTQNKKMQISSDSTNVYLKPDLNSTVVSVLGKGELVSLASSRRFRKEFIYVYFRTPGGALKLRLTYVSTIRVWDEKTPAGAHRASPPVFSSAASRANMRISAGPPRSASL